jgi:hypothetical protein
MSRQMMQLMRRIKKDESQGKKCHDRIKIHIEADKGLKMNSHHVSLRQSVEEIRLRKE